MEKKKLITLGCSWTDRYSADHDPWPEIIEKRTGWDVTNYGKCGTGNKYAFDHFLIHLKTKGIPDKVYWLITEFYRIDLINKQYPKGISSFRPDSWAANIYRPGDPDEIRSRELEKSAIFWQMKNPTATVEHVDRFERSLKQDWEILEVLSKSRDLQLTIDYNLDLIYKTQLFCKFYNIELKIAAALQPIRYYGDTDPSEVAKSILKSRISKKIDLQSIMGWPFMTIAGGMNAESIESWAEKYGIAHHDNHPSTAGSELLADFFLGEKNIFDYKK